LCFARHPLEIALRSIAELEFHKFELAIHEGGPHLKPSEVEGDIGAAATRLRVSPGLVPSAFSVEIEAATDEDYLKQFKAVCRLARISAVPLVSLTASPVGAAMDAEIARLQKLTSLADGEGVLVDVETKNGTLTEDPDQAVALCQAVPGLGLTYDPSHYLTGPYKNRSHDQIFPYVRHVRLRDTGKKPDQFQVRVGQGQVEYGRIITQLSRHRYDRVLAVDIRDVPDLPFNMTPEVRKLKYLLESLV
jgi:sugar phosphate isomerase/epimerase